jgi:hypothetical protein
MTVTALPKQTIHDVCIQHYGSLDGLADLMTRNPQLTITEVEGEELAVGTVINIPIARIMGTIKPVSE